MTTTAKTVTGLDISAQKIAVQCYDKEARAREVRACAHKGKPSDKHKKRRRLIVRAAIAARKGEEVVALRAESVAHALRVQSLAKSGMLPDDGGDACPWPLEQALSAAWADFAEERKAARKAGLSPLARRQPQEKHRRQPRGIHFTSMKTHLITQSGIVSNTPDNRKASFLFLSRWTGYDESSDDLREKFALRSVEPDEDEEGNVTSHSVVYHSREEGNRERESIEVDHFTLETDAKAFADNENFRLLGEYIRDDSNFTLLDLPDGWEAEMGTVRNGKYPQSRSVEVTLHARGESYGGAAHWDCHLITDTWLDTEKVKHAIVELMDDMLSGVLDGLKKASDSATALKDAAELLAEIMRDEVNHQDEAEKWLREYAPEHLFPDTHHKTSTL